MILRSDVPELLREALPSYRRRIDGLVTELGMDAVNYPLMVELTPTILAEFQRTGESTNLVAFFGACEDMLSDGEPGVRDLIELELIEPIADPNVAHLQLQRFLGPMGLASLQAYRERRRKP